MRTNDHFVEAAGERLALSVLERPAGPELVLFIHGIGCIKESFAGAWEADGLAAYTLVSPDLPGHGENPCPAGFECSMENYAEAMHGLLAHYRYDRLHVVGHSLGGVPGLLLAAAADGRLASFTNIEGNLVPEDCSMFSRRAAAVPFATFRDVNMVKLRAGAAQSDDVGLRLWTEWSQSADVRAVHQCSISLVEWSDNRSLMDIYAGLEIPTLYVYGERSANPATLKALAGHATEEIPECGHFVMNERPEAFYPLLAGFLTTAAASRNPAR